MSLQRKLREARLEGISKLGNYESKIKQLLKDSNIEVEKEVKTGLYIVHSGHLMRLGYDDDGYSSAICFFMASN